MVLLAYLQSNNLHLKILVHAFAVYLVLRLCKLANGSEGIKDPSLRSALCFASGQSGHLEDILS